MGLFGRKSYYALMTVPNIITFSGIIFIGIYVREFLLGGNRWVMFVSLFLAGLSDLLDGEASRRLHQKSQLGEFLDPLRDRLLLLAVLANVLYVAGINIFVIFWGTLIVSVELVAAFFNLFFTPPQKRKVHLAGKLRQAVHLFLAGLVVLSFYFRDIIFTVTGINFNFGFSSALPLMALCSFVALICYLCRASLTK